MPLKKGAFSAAGIPLSMAVVKNEALSADSKGRDSLLTVLFW
jgi:hypothetical protein